ncbi:6,7-dimethyl-8-ribityllumazine synthase [Candidatus Cyanaurora vandensis]|uniref:6,7-dimethyl-8-ribityllumazine synthase n=1 Tax=Candidatus Cyanaurora vandensis TaxID=2714958 RepID=UPI0025806258|nr:6,7-dimethyl-8-ribityllumazine synthase [Candidatus Cyanaurora vandensis]
MTVYEGRLDHTKDLKVAIVIARFNDLITTKLLSGCEDALRRHGVDLAQQVDYAWVPGCFEIPLVAQAMARKGTYDAVICLGAVIRGQAPHFEYVAKKVADGVAAVMLETGVPVVFGILTTDNMQQALERAGVKDNKGWSYGQDAIEMATLMSSVRMISGLGTLEPQNALRAEGNATIALPPSLLTRGE